MVVDGCLLTGRKIQVQAQTQVQAQVQVQVQRILLPIRKPEVLENSLQSTTSGQAHEALKRE